MNLSEKLIVSDDPVNLIWQELKDIYLSTKTEDIQEYYKKTEKELVKLEEFLFCSYFEFYQVDLIKKVQNQTHDILTNINNDNAYLVMDAFSLREMGLLADDLMKKFNSIDIEYNFSALPSDTQFFRNNIDYETLKDAVNFYHIREYDSIDLDGQEKFIWSRYPDLLIENVRSGQSLKIDLEEVYEKTMNVIFAVINALETDKIFIISDHGYIRSESGYNITIKNKTVKNWLRNLFDGSRFIAKSESDEDIAEKLMEKNMIAETEDYYFPISHYAWPVSGSYSTFSHGGLSLLEVITPKIIIHK